MNSHQNQPEIGDHFPGCIRSWKYPARLPGFELSQPIATAQREFDACLANVLDDMADRMEGRSSAGEDNFESSVERLDQAIRTHSAGKSPDVLAVQLGAFVPLSYRIESLTLSLNEEIRRNI